MKAGIKLIAVACLFASTGALAGHCPVDMQQIDAALQNNPKLTAEQLQQVKQLRAEGETLHKGGKHQESVAALGKAKEILGL